MTDKQLGNNISLLLRDVHKTMIQKNYTTVKKVYLPYVKMCLINIYVYRVLAVLLLLTHQTSNSIICRRCVTRNYTYKPLNRYGYNDKK